jgi:hypothetical protein
LAKEAASVLGKSPRNSVGSFQFVLYIIPYSFELPKRSGEIDGVLSQQHKKGKGMRSIPTLTKSLQNFKLFNIARFGEKEYDTNEYDTLPQKTRYVPKGGADVEGWS